MIAVLLVVKLQPMVALAPVVADPLHAIDHQGLDAQPLQSRRGRDAGMTAADDEDLRLAAVIAHRVTPPVEPVGSVEVTFEGGLLGRLEDRLLLMALQFVERGEQRPRRRLAGTAVRALQPDDASSTPHPGLEL